MIHCYEFYASPVISKPRCFELFSISLGDFEIAGFNCIIIIIIIIIIITIIIIIIIIKEPWYNEPR